MRGYRRDMIRIWNERRQDEILEQRLADQVRTILKRNWFMEVELEELKKLNFERIYETNSAHLNSNNPDKQEHDDFVEKKRKISKLTAAFDAKQSLKNFCFLNERGEKWKKIANAT